MAQQELALFSVSQKLFLQMLYKVFPHPDLLQIHSKKCPLNFLLEFDFLCPKKLLSLSLFLFCLLFFSFSLKYISQRITFPGS